jgi:hypothetical protein
LLWQPDGGCLAAEHTLLVNLIMIGAAFAADWLLPRHAGPAKCTEPAGERGSPNGPPTWVAHHNPARPRT